MSISKSSSARYGRNTTSSSLSELRTRGSKNSLKCRSLEIPTTLIHDEFKFSLILVSSYRRESSALCLIRASISSSATKKAVLSALIPLENLSNNLCRLSSQAHQSPGLSSEVYQEQTW